MASYSLELTASNAIGYLINTNFPLDKSIKIICQAIEKEDWNLINLIPNFSVFERLPVNVLLELTHNLKHLTKTVSDKTLETLFSHPINLSDINVSIISDDCIENNIHKNYSFNFNHIHQLFSLIASERNNKVVLKYLKIANSLGLLESLVDFDIVFHIGFYWDTVSNQCIPNIDLDVFKYIFSLTYVDPKKKSKVSNLNVIDHLWIIVENSSTQYYHQFKELLDYVLEMKILSEDDLVHGSSICSIENCSIRSYQKCIGGKCFAHRKLDSILQTVNKERVLYKEYNYQHKKGRWTCKFKNCKQIASESDYCKLHE